MGVFLDRYLAVSEDLISASLGSGAINGIIIDNPSGSWLLVEPIHLFVPPYTSGWKNPVPNSLSVSVTWVDSPSGSKSTAVLPTDQKVHVHLNSDPLPHFDGFPSGSGARVDIVPPFLTAWAFVTVGEDGTAMGGFPWNIPVIVPCVLRRITTVPAFTTLGGSAALSAAMQIGFGTLPAPSFAIDQAISPEAPFAESLLEDGGYRVPLGSTLQASGYSEQGGGRQFALVTVQYYPEVVSV